MNEKYFLKSERLGFRTWSRNDIDLAIELYGNPVVTKYIGGPVSYGKIQRKLSTQLSIIRMHHVQQWPVFLLTNDEFIGSCGLNPYEPSNKRYEIAILLKPEFWGQGYGAEATSAVIQYAFNNLDVASLYAGHHPENIVSKKLIEKLGFQYSHNEYYQPTGLEHTMYKLIH